MISIFISFFSFIKCFVHFIHIIDILWKRSGSFFWSLTASMDWIHNYFLSNNPVYLWSRSCLIKYISWFLLPAYLLYPLGWLDGSFSRGWIIRTLIVCYQCFYWLFRRVFPSIKCNYLWTPWHIYLFTIFMRCAKLIQKKTL